MTECTLKEENSEIIKLDLYRTCRDDQDLHEVGSYHQIVELVLCNFVKQNESTTGYFQGLNFVAHYISIMMEDPLMSLSLLNYVGETVYAVAFNH